VAEEPFRSQTPGRRARTLLRFLHTGEAFGLAGQTIAGLVTAASLVMVWTGWALAYRRLVRPLFERRRAGSVGA
ncbi:MAG TPA: PepSY domain-containing protein, partial [Gammaproteobacteria bacterium]|nr:PepSY domain-containing protein [Gammaproteobacteria bacterium]